MGKHKHKTSEIDEEKGTLLCAHCGEVPIKWRKIKGVERAYCSVSVAEQKTKWHKNNPTYVSPNWNPSKAPTKIPGLTRGEVTLAKQGKSCQICGTTENLHLDHDHKTERVRGVLCRNHNVGLGMFSDNVEYLKAAIDYLGG